MPIRASAWGSSGHRIIGRIAFDRLSPSARQEVRNLLGDEKLEIASVWADTIKAQQPKTAAFHYIDWALQRNSYVRARDCPQVCVIEEINLRLDALRSPKSSTRERTEAFKFLIHLVGDLHQPFHVTTNIKPKDNGADLVVVTLVKNQTSKKTDLHSVWDDEIIKFAMEQSNLRVDQVDLYAAQLSNKYSPGPFTQSPSMNISTQGSVVDWGLETHWLSWEAYKLSNGWFMVAQESADTRKFTIDEAYLQKNRPIVERQLVRAGARLAKLLNEAFAPRNAF